MSHVPVLAGTGAESPAAGSAHKTESKAGSCFAPAPSESSRGERGTAGGDPERASAETRDTLHVNGL